MNRILFQNYGLKKFFDLPRGEISGILNGATYEQIHTKAHIINLDITMNIIIRMRQNLDLC